MNSIDFYPLHRFLEALDGIKDMSTLLFAKYNQYDSDDQGFIGEGLLRRVLANTYYEHILPPVAKKAHKDSSLMQTLAEQFEVVKAFWHKESHKDGQKDEQKAQDKK